MANPRAIIITALPVEYKAVRAYLTDIQEETHPQGTVYEKGVFSTNGKVWEVSIVEIGAGNNAASFEVERAISRFEPSVVLFVGVAGGVKDVKIGDVVAATKVYGYESGKAGQTFKARPSVGNSAYDLVQRARAEAKSQDWLKRIIKTAGDWAPRALVGPMAAGEKVITSTDTELFQFLQSTYNDILAVDMEGRGFLEAAHANHAVMALVVRGISDLIDNKSDVDDALRQEVAARHASAFAFEILAKFDARDVVRLGPSNSQISTRRLSGPPNSPRYFLGRAEDMSELKARLGIGGRERTANMVQLLTAVHGWPGIGKTATATVLARDPDVSDAFPDGILWTSLGPSPQLFSELASWGRALGTDEILGVPTLKEATRFLAALLHEKRMLLVVDDVWEEAHVIPFQDVRGTNCALLITTRQPGVVNNLHLPSEAIYNLPALTEDSAMELLRLLAPGVVAEHPTVCLELVRDIECLPLALHVAGGLLNAESKIGWDMSGLLQELREGARLIEAKAPPDMMDYESETIPTVAALLKKSTDGLDQRARDCFALLGAFPSKPATFDLEALKAVWQVDDPKPIARTLLDRGLLEPVGGRLQMHALLATYARSLLSLD